MTGRSQAVRHDIETNGARPVQCGPRRLAPAGLRTEQIYQRHVGRRTHLVKWQSLGVACSTRFCVNYLLLNATTVKDAYPLLRIDDGRQQCFSTMDLASGYWQVAMSPDASRNAAFVSHEGLFHFRVMPFGLCSTPATFKRLMDRVLSGICAGRGV